MTSLLQRQLAAINAKSTHQLDLKTQKVRHSKSLLFDPRDAAVQRFDTIFQICLEGFEDLCQLDNRFLPFGRNLFSEQSKNEERTQMTQEENDRLDKVIIAFLGLLGSRLLLRPGMKAAEWLVRRFQVHEYNTEPLLMTFLPYHASPAFATLLSILPEQLPTKFHFLHPYVASLQSPPRTVVVTAIGNNAGLMTAYSKYVIAVAEARHHSASLLGFWASITAQALSMMIEKSQSGRRTIRQQEEEDILLRILPILQSALLIRDTPELYLGACMIMTILVTQAPPEDAVLNAMMKAVAKGWSTKNFEDGVTCLAVLAEEKETLQIPRSVASSIWEHADAVRSLERIAARYRTDQLIASVLLAAIKRTTLAPEASVSRFLLAVPRMVNMQERYTAIILEAAMNAMQSDVSSATRDVSSKILLDFLQIYVDMPEHTDLMRQMATRTQFSLAQLGADQLLDFRNLKAAGNDGESHTAMELDSEPLSVSEKPYDLSALPTVPSLGYSFLTEMEDTTFRAFSDAFRFSLSSKDSIANLLDHASLAKIGILKQPNFLSFMARLWTSDMASNERFQALKLARQSLQHCIEDGTSLGAMQALIPYLILALSDSSKAIRTEAATFVLCMKGPKSRGRQTTDADAAGIWARTSVYGRASSQIVWLSSSDHNEFMSKALLPVLEDCILDGAFIVSSLSNSINGSSVSAAQDRPTMKSATRQAICESLVSHAINTPVIKVKEILLEILSKAGKAANTTRTAHIVPYLRKVVSLSDRPRATEYQRRTAKSSIKCLSHRTFEEIQLMEALACGELHTDEEITSNAFARIKKIFPSVRGNAQTELFNWLLKASIDDEMSDWVRSSALETIRNIVLPTEVLVPTVESLPSVVELQDQPTPAKKQRNSRTSDTPRAGSIQKEKLTLALRKITLVLELVEASRPERHPQLLRGLFHLLSEIHHFKTVVGSDLAYMQGLLIGSLQAVVDGLKATTAKDVERSVIRADLIVECVRTTPNTQVHNAALLLMSSLASWAPDHVLHSVMPLFTFMSSTILKQGDDYSAHVTEQAVARIIPPLAASLRRNGKDLVSGAADLLLSFTAAYEHIPLHRRSGIFKHLVQTLGPDESLFAIEAMLVERYGSDVATISFITDLMSKFPVAVQLRAAGQYLNLIFDTLAPKRGLSDTILGYAEKNETTAKQATAVLQNGLASALMSETLRRQILKELGRDETSAKALNVVYSELLEKAMQLVLQCRVDGVLQPSADKVLSTLLQLMPTTDFIDAIANLMQSGTDDIRQQVFASLESRVATAKRADVALQKVFIGVLPNCGLFIAKSRPTATRRAAIACIDQIVEKFGKTDPTAVVEVAHLVAGDHALGSDDTSLRIVSLLCLASMVEVAEDEFIPILPSALQKALDYLDAAVSYGDVDPSLYRAAFSLASAVLDHLPWMLSARYLDPFMKIVARSANEEPSVAQVSHNFCSLAAKKLPAQECFGALDRTWTHTVNGGPDAVQQQLRMFEAAVQFHTKATVTKNAPALFSILQSAFELRSTLPTTEASDSLKLQELFSSVDRAALEVVMKLNNATFRPFFIRLVEWATNSNTKQAKASQHLRCTSLYSFAFVLFEQLKSLVTSYVSFLLENATALLNSLRSSNDVERELLHLVLQTLASNFRHDQDEFWQAPAHFEAVVQPMLAQLKRANALTTEQHLIPAITDLAAAAGSSEHHKAVNSALMACMRHEDDAVRLAAVKCERAITTRLSLDWLTLLPEMLPFISELQEDDDEAVERETLRWVKQIEEVTGESLEGMLQ